MTEKSNGGEKTGMLLVVSGVSNVVARLKPSVECCTGSSHSKGRQPGRNSPRSRVVEGTQGSGRSAEDQRSTRFAVWEPVMK